MVSAGFGSILRSARADFNSRFAAMRRTHPDLQPDTFAEFLEGTVNELIIAVEKTRPDRLGESVQAAYDAALELVGQRLAGPGARILALEEGWRRILPKVAPLVAVAPERMIPAVCNALHRLASTPGARLAYWIESMEKLGPRCTDPDQFLKFGQLAAWRSGLAHFRQGAVLAADALPEPAVLDVFGVQAGVRTWAGLRERLLADPWFDPAAAHPPKGLRIVAQVGAFRGFGGLFAEPPSVVSSNQDFLVRSDGDSWLLTADAFGATFHRASEAEFEAAKQQHRLPQTLRVQGTQIEYAGSRLAFPALGSFTSAAANDTTLALTSQLMHSIVLVALR